jgi:amidase
MRTTAGFVPLKDYVPKEDATVVARLRAAGAIILGKTNMPKLAAGYYTDNEVFGMTNNPWNVAYTPGGSTGGGAAAVASCMSPLEIGSDLAGSVRWPAHCCGLFGLKPTEWRVSWSGHIPDLPGKPRGLRHMLALGPLARTVEDLVIALKLISGPDAKIWEVPPAPLLDPGKAPLKGLKVGYVPQFGSLTTTKETREGLDKLASGLASHGAHVEQAEITGFDFQTYDSVFERIFEGELSAANPRPTTPTMQDYTLALAQKDAFMAVMDAFLANYDVMLCPAAARQAFRHDSSPNTQDIDGKSVDYGDAAGWYCRPFNLTGNPAVVLPLFQGKDGLPIGLQLVGRRWSEMRLLAIAASITEVSREFVRPPGY